MSHLAMPRLAPTGRKRKGLTPLIQKGDFEAESFNPVAERPNPNFVQLEQRIRVTMFYDIPSWLTTSTSAPVSQQRTVQLSDFANNGEYTSLFDQYRILQAEVWVTPGFIESATYTSDIASCVDLDDANAASFSVVASKQGSMITGGCAGIYHRWQPHVAMAAYSPSSFASYANVPSPWIDSASPAVSHFGFKVATNVAAPAVQYNLTVRAVVEFRAPGV
jgi:hypothetical protein